MHIFFLLPLGCALCEYPPKRVSVTSPVTKSRLCKWGLISDCAHPRALSLSLAFRSHSPSSRAHLCWASDWSVHTPCSAHRRWNPCRRSNRAFRGTAPEPHCASSIAGGSWCGLLDTQSRCSVGMRTTECRNCRTRSSCSESPVGDWKGYFGIFEVMWFCKF